MNKKQVYLSLPISGYDEGKRRRFAQQTIRELKSQHKDWDIINPFDIADELRQAFGERGQYPQYEDFMFSDLMVLRKCDMAVFCKGWEASEGCKREMDECRKNNIEVKFL